MAERTMASRGRVRPLILSSHDVRAILDGVCTSLTFPVKLPQTSNHRGKWAIATVNLRFTHKFEVIRFAGRYDTSRCIHARQESRAT